MTVQAGALVVGGDSLTQCDPCNGLPALARWDGSTWTSMEPGGEGVILALASFGRELIVGGTFSWLGSPPYSSYWARWGATSSSNAADFNRDCFVDDEDLRVFAACAGGPGVAPPSRWGCLDQDYWPLADLDGDGDVDMGDFGFFQTCYAGERYALDPACVLWWKPSNGAGSAHR